MSDERLDDLTEALEQCGRLVAAEPDPEWGAATPCAAWDVRALVTHLVDGHRLFAAALGGPAGPDAPDEDLVTAYGASAEVMLAAFGEPGVLERAVTVGIGTVPGAVALNLRVVEALVHGWDLAQATGQEPVFRPALAEKALRFTEGALPSIPTGHRPFEPPHPVAADAPPLDRLVALLGRRPGPPAGSTPA
jgi:uncharacterized protein (TIGR03086 family)